MTTTASAWLAYELSHDAFVVGLVPFANQIPILLLAPFTGVWGDRLNRHRLMILLQSLSALPSALLAVLTLTGEITVGWLLGVALLRGVVNAFEFPTRQSFIIELISKKADLPNAIALNSSMFNVARLVGPSVAGVLIVTVGPGLCYALDALSFAGIVAGLLAMKLTALPRRKHRPHPWIDLREGWRHTWRAPELRSPIAMVAAVALTGFSASILAPVFARDIYHQDARTLGLMYAAIAVGAIASGLWLSARPSAEGLPRWITRGALLVAASQIGFALTSSLPVALLALVGTGLGVALVMAPCNTLVQHRVQDEKRSRVMGLFAMGQGMFPVGSLLIGWLAAGLTPRAAMLISGAACALAALAFARALQREPATAANATPLRAAG